MRIRMHISMVRNQKAAKEARSESVRIQNERGKSGDLDQLSLLCVQRERETAFHISSLEHHEHDHGCGVEGSAKDAR
jgi:hypothetical protein